MDSYLQQGIAAAKAGDTSRAFDLLTRASQHPANAEQAWLWLSSVVGDDSERLFCLDSVLRVNPGNKAAQRGAALLRQQGIFPAVPVYPEPQRAAPRQEISSRPNLSPKSSQVNFASLAGTAKEPVPIVQPRAQTSSTFEMDWNRQDHSGLFEYAAMELANQKSRQQIEKELVSRGASPKEAKTIVGDAQYALKKGRRDKYKKRLTRGLIWTILGVVITCGTYTFASELGGKFYIFYGAIIFGVIDFVIGLIGWLTNSW
jgi:hypothetical protein